MSRRRWRCWWWIGGWSRTSWATRGGSTDGNARNGTRAKTVVTTAGPVPVDVPRDRAGTVEARIVAKRRRRLGSMEDIVLSLSARGMTPGDIAAHLADVYGSQLSRTTISTGPDTVFDGRAECSPAASPAASPAPEQHDNPLQSHRHVDRPDRDALILPVGRLID